MATEQQLANRMRLIDALRAEMPEGFTWDFGEVLEEHKCGSVGCAMGLAAKIGLVSERNVCHETVADAIGIDVELAGKIFAPGVRNCLAEGYPVTYGEVTPQMVADKLEAI